MLLQNLRSSLNVFRIYIFIYQVGLDQFNLFDYIIGIIIINMSVVLLKYFNFIWKGEI